LKIKFDKQKQNIYKRRINQIVKNIKL